MTAIARDQVAEPAPLPKLRADLLVDLLPEHGHAFPSVIVTDPVRACYFRLAWPECGMWLIWQTAETVPGLVDRLSRDFGYAVSEADVGELVEFAQKNQLIEADQHQVWGRLAAIKAGHRKSMLGSVLHNYLFFRVPLVHPERWLNGLLPRLRFVYSPWFWVMVGLIALVGVHLALRQWSAVVASAANALQLQSLTTYAVAILALKGIHELGHALTATRYGCRIPSMGIAVMLGAPVFYTDTSDCWRLARRQERLAIVFAGVAAEFVVAAAAILLWSFLPDGAARQICFAFATASIALSLVVNLNPCMRFDGYFALSDYLEVPNLQGRAFALGLWRLREFLFDLGHPPPEELPRDLRKTLIVYAFVTAIYRLFLFLGIAAMVYVVAGKAVGIVLGIVELGVFIVLPIWREVATWWSLRQEIVRRSRLWVTSGAFGLGVLAMIVPWVSTIEAPAVIVAGSEEGIYLPFAARLTEIHVVSGQRVRTGDLLFSADAADLERAHRKAALQERALQAQTARLHASDKERELRLVLEARLERTREEIASLDRRMEQLKIRAPFDGRIVDLDPEISTGLWFNEKRPLAHLVTESGSRARGLIAETDLSRVQAGAGAVFIADDAARARLNLTVASISPASDSRLPEAMLADRHGGRILAGRVSSDLVTLHGHFEVTFGEFPASTPQVVRGVARIDAVPVSPVSLLWRSIAQVLVREQGF